MQIFLRNPPTISVTSVTDDSQATDGGDAIASTDYIRDDSAGSIKLSGDTSAFAHGEQAAKFVYRGGFEPDEIRDENPGLWMAVMITAGSLWNNPDLLLVWESGMPAHTVDELRSRGYRVESIRTRNLADVGTAMIRLGELTGRLATAEVAAGQFTDALAQLSEQYRDAEPINVFFQISARPLYTINQEHFISEIITLCGGRNVFDDLDEMAPSVSVEAVLDRDPEVMLAGTNSGDDAFDEWARWPGLAANRYGNQFLLPDETIGRPIPRLALAGRSLCIALDQARRNRAAAQ